MNNSACIIQNPLPGKHLLLFRGDTITFTLSLSCSKNGSAWIRTNIGYAEIGRNETIKKTENDEPPLARDWFDIPMTRIDERNFKIILPLCEVGHFQAKCLFLEENKSDPLWPEGLNTVINVEPADTCCSNIIYNAFVRQFGSNKTTKEILDPEKTNCIKSLDSSGYSVIPPSGTFRDLISELDFIIGELGCRIIQLLPIHPVPVTYARMGRFGSPYASLSFTTVDPALAEFDPYATPMEQFVELVDAVHKRCGKIVIDIAINHTGWAADLHETNPEWLARDSRGQIEVPGAWGVIWEDLTKLDYTHKELRQYMADVFLLWRKRGVDGFRCDAGYMISVDVWEYIVASVRNQYPDTVFIIEGLGGKISVTEDILDRADFNFAYSELFQNYDRSRIEDYLPGCIKISQESGLMIHFAETHDNKRLAERSKDYAVMRTALCALCSANGAFGFANGLEWLATEKIDVHGNSCLNWGAEINQVHEIRRLNKLLKIHPAFYDKTDLSFIQNGEGNYIVLLRHNIFSGKKLLIVANLDDKNSTAAAWNSDKAGMKGKFFDLLTGNMITVNLSKKTHTCLLDPGRVFCLTDCKEDIDLLQDDGSLDFTVPERIEKQSLRAKALEVFCWYNRTDSQKVVDLKDFDPDLAARQLADNPVAYCRKLNSVTYETRVTIWQWPRDLRRQVMVPPDHFLLVRSDYPFHASIIRENSSLAKEQSLLCGDGSFFALFYPLPPSRSNCPGDLKISLYTPEKCEHINSPILFLTRPENISVKKHYKRSELLDMPPLFLGTNGCGGMLRADVDWGKLNTRYDALLAANLNPGYPENRRIMFSRCRAWVVFQGYSQEISISSIDSFCFDYNSRGIWRYKIPTGQGEHIVLGISLEMIYGKNAARIVFFRHPADGKHCRLADSKKIKLILRPDIEDRNFHETIKAYQGPENSWPEAVTTYSQGFAFKSSTGNFLRIKILNGAFTSEPEWEYMVCHPGDAERGTDPESDLFSPGYFTTFLEGGQAAELYADIAGTDKEKSSAEFTIKNPSLMFNYDTSPDISRALKSALNHYVVKHENLKTVIAGYPWFLDWGRDALIFTRGLIAAGQTKAALDILQRFSLLEKGGTLPNMIRGGSAENRDTSDAPLWFFVACSDFINVEKNPDLLDMRPKDRSIRETLVSIGLSLIAGTFNGIRMDRESALIFSPSHFTWMDTDNPAGTPREGYPVEIQALWYFALCFLARIDDRKTREYNWEKLAERVCSSIHQLYWIEEKGYLSDCLHASSGTPALQADRDDALRPNQLFAVTLEAVKNREVIMKIMEACEELLIPGAVRSLADRPVKYPVEITLNGKMINDPYNPYHGEYTGDEDTRRKPAYHNGTAWTWLLPIFCEAWIDAYGRAAKNTALAMLGSSAGLINRGCAGHVPEILDGNFPHTRRGCDAQAWGASELLRVWEKLKAL